MEAVNDGRRVAGQAEQRRSGSHVAMTCRIVALIPGRSFCGEEGSGYAQLCGMRRLWCQVGDAQQGPVVPEVQAFGASRQFRKRERVDRYGRDRETTRRRSAPPFVNAVRPGRTYCSERRVRDHRRTPESATSSSCGLIWTADNTTVVPKTRTLGLLNLSGTATSPRYHSTS
jgi:hypothetical protein